ncbi:hypothetical protein PRIC1_004578 [Phytophthora ramorum]
MKTRCRVNDESSPTATGATLSTARSATSKKSPERRVVKLNKHRTDMVKFRVRKKEEADHLRSEHRMLERVMKRFLRTLEKEASLKPMHAGIGAHCTTNRMHELVAETEAVRKQNMALLKVIERHKFSHQLFVDRAQLESNTPDSPLLASCGDDGWWVHFPAGIPSFYYRPLSPAEVEATANPFNASFSTDLPETSLAGNFLGWNVYRELDVLDEASEKEVVSRVRFTKRLRCSIDTAAEVSSLREDELRPLLATPSAWNSNERHKVSSQVLQEVDPECRVMVHNIAGSTNIRYVFLARSAQWKLHGGKRKMAFSMMTNDSKANKMNRDAEVVERNVEWLAQGWAYFTITEVADNAIDVVYEQCSRCENESHAGLLMAQWAQVIVRWEQIIVPFNMLST